MTALLALPAVRWVLSGAVVFMLALGALGWLRRDAADDALAHEAARAAHSQEEKRHEAESAARAADRDGAADRLRSGNF